MPQSTVWNNEMPLGRFLSLLTKSYYGALTKKLEHLDVDHYYSILITIEGFNGAHCNQQTLCDLLKFDKASMVKRIDYLAKKGLVKRCVNPDDRREHQINLTDKAVKIMPEIHKAVNELNNEATKGLSQEEKEQFYKSLWMVYDNITSQPAHKVIYNLKKIK